MANWAQVQKSDDVVVGVGNGPAVPSPPPEADHYAFALSNAEYASVAGSPMFWGSDETKPRWKIESNALTEQSDPRWPVVFDPATVVTPYASGQTVSVDVEVRQKGNPSLIDTNISGDFDVKVQAQGPGAAPLWLRVSIANGIGTILIDRGIVKEAMIADQGAFKVDVPLRVRVLAPGRF
jgi:hypothetical protein